MKKIIRVLLCVVMACFGSVQAKFDIAAINIPSFVGGVASSACIALVYSFLSDRYDQKATVAQIENIKNSIQLQQRYIDLYDHLQPLNDDQKMQKLVMMMRSDHTIIDFLEHDSVRLKEEMVVIRQLKSEKNSPELLKQDLSILEKQGAETLNKMNNLCSVIEQNRPFIQLMLAQKQSATQLQSYERIVKLGTKFPQITVVDAMNRDITQLVHWLQSAQAICERSECSSFKAQLIDSGYKQMRLIENACKKITQSAAFCKERERFEQLDAQIKKIEAEKAAIALQQAQVNVEQDKVAAKLNQQAIKREQLRQNDEQLRLNQFALQQGRYFEPIKKQLEAQIFQLQSENRVLMERKATNEGVLRDIQKEAEQLKNEKERMMYQINHLHEKLKNINDYTQQLEQKLNNPPYNPESDDGLFFFLHTLRELAEKINRESGC